MIILKPFKNTKITQWFGENMCDFYKKLGLLGHNGWDYSSPNGQELRFNVTKITKRAVVTDASDSPTYGKKVAIEFEDGDRLFKVSYGHLKDYCVKIGDYVDLGDLIGHTDNTGIYTTGPHLHFGLYEYNLYAHEKLNPNNGFAGAIDPKPWYKDMFVLDYISNLQSQISVIQKLIELLKKLLNKNI